MRLAREHAKTLFLIGLLIGASSLVVAYSLSNTVQVDGDVPVVAADGPNVTYVGNANQVNLADPFPDANTVELSTDTGNATFSSVGPTNLSIDQSNITGTYTVVSELDVATNELTINPEDKPAVDVSGDLNRLEFTDMVVDDGNLDFIYEGASGTTTLTVRDVAQNEDIAAVDRDTGNVLASGTSDGSGVLTLTSMPNSVHEVELQTSEGVPEQDNPSPTGELRTEPSDLSIDVADSDFPSDTVDATISLDGTQELSTSITSNQTLTTSIPASGKTGGTHTWTVNLTDSFGNSNNQTYEYKVPANLTIRNESVAHGIIQQETDILVIEQNTEDPEIINKTITDGNLSLLNFPVQNEVVIHIQTSGYHNRTILLDDFFSQQEAYLLHRSVPSNLTRFDVVDNTGLFPDEDAEIIVQRPINRSLFATGGLTWRTVSGNNLGAEGFFVDDLEHETIYRVKVANDAGDERNLGEYVVEEDGTFTLEIGSFTADPDENAGTIAYDARLENESNQQEQVIFEYNNSNRTTEKIWFTIYEYQNESNVLVANQSFTGPYGEFSYVQDVPVGEEGKTWVVKATTVLENGDVKQIKQPVGSRAGAVLGDIPGWLLSVIWVGGILMLAGAFSQLNGDLGGVVIAGFAGLLYFAGLAPPVIGGGVVLLAMLAAAVLFVNERRDGGL